MRYKMLAAVGAVLLMFIAGAAYAADRKGDATFRTPDQSRLIVGFVDENYGDRITVGNDVFFFSGVAIEDKYGKRAEASALIRGVKVKVLTVNGKTTKIVILFGSPVQ